MIDTRIEQLTKSLLALISKPQYSISDLQKNVFITDIDLVRGVYLLSPPNRSEDIVYVGRTKKNSVMRRLTDHCMSKTKSDLNGMVLHHPTYHQYARHYEARWLRVDDYIERAQLEMFAIAVLKPIFNRYD